MQSSVVLSDDDVAAEVRRLCARVHQVRVDAGRTTREVAAAAGVNLGTLFRTEHARIQPAYLTFARLAEVLGRRLEVDDGANRPRTLARHLVPVHSGLLWPPGVNDGSAEYLIQTRLHYRLAWMGEEMLWARRNDPDRHLTDDAVCALLGISHHTLRSVELGARTEGATDRDGGGSGKPRAVGWPRLSSIVRVAALTGRRLVLADETELLRLPPWDLGAGQMDQLPRPCWLPGMSEG